MHSAKCPAANLPVQATARFYPVWENIAILKIIHFFEDSGSRQAEKITDQDLLREVLNTVGKENRVGDSIPLCGIARHAGIR
jgi:hypothetical protein